MNLPRDNKFAHNTRKSILCSAEVSFFALQTINFCAWCAILCCKFVELFRAGMTRGNECGEYAPPPCSQLVSVSSLEL